MTNDAEFGLPLKSLLTRTLEFEDFTAAGSKLWTLPMAAALFIWRNLAAVDDQGEIVTGAWAAKCDPPTDPYGRLRFAFQFEKLRAIIVKNLRKRVASMERDSYADEW